MLSRNIREKLNLLKRFSVPSNETISILLVIVLFFSISTFFYNKISNKELILEQTISNDLKILEARIENIDSKIQNLALIGPTPKSIDYGAPTKVVRVIDGDTIEIESGEHLRYIGIDTPEKNDPRKPVQCFAEEASKRNKELVEGKTIKFYKDITERDKYGRLLGYVYLEDGAFVNSLLVKEGFAFSYSYPPDISKQEEFLEAEKEARLKKAGLWSACSVSDNATGREETNSLENDNLND